MILLLMQIVQESKKIILLQMRNPPQGRERTISFLMQNPLQKNKKRKKRKTTIIVPPLPPPPNANSVYHPCASLTSAIPTPNVFSAIPTRLDSANDAKPDEKEKTPIKQKTTTIVPALPPPPNANSTILLCHPCASLPNATSAIPTPNATSAIPTRVNFSPTQFAFPAIPAPFPPPTPNIPPTNKSPQREERRDLLSDISHQLGCDESHCDRSTRSVRESLGSVRVAHESMGSENEADIQNSAVRELVETLHF